MKWSNSLLVNFLEIDEDHKEWINTINDIEFKWQNTDSKKELINHLLKYTNGHFSREESIMRKYNYPAIEDHMNIHESFRQKILALEFNNNKMNSIEIFNLLENWLIQHISHVDKITFSFINNHRDDA